MEAKKIIASTMVICSMLVPSTEALAYSSGSSSFLPLAISAVSTVGTLSVITESSASWVIAGVEASAQSTVYILRRLNDGVVSSITVAGQSMTAGSVAVGASVQASALGLGVLLSVGNDVIGFVPNKQGQVLFHNQILSR